MALSMGFARAIQSPPTASEYAEGSPHEGGSLWRRVDYVGANSGGTWFTMQFFFSKQFFHYVTDMATPIGDVVSEWFYQYQTGVAMASARAKQQEHVRSKVTHFQRTLNYFLNTVLRRTTITTIDEYAGALRQSQELTGGSVEWVALTENMFNSFTPFLGAQSTTYSNTPRVPQMEKPTLVSKAIIA